MSNKWRYYVLTVAVWLGYVVLAYVPANYIKAAEMYQTTPMVIGLLVASLQIPILACWLLAVAGWFYFRQYVRSLPPSAVSRPGYRLLLGALLALVLAVILPTLINTLTARLVGGGPTPWRTIMNTYITIGLPLIAFWLASLGSTRLIESVKQTARSWLRSAVVLVPIVVFGAFYITLIFTNPSRQVSANPAIPATYYLPDILIVLTIIVPVIATWAMGLQFVLNLERYSHYVAPGRKAAFISIYNGALAIIGSVVLQQVISSLGSTRATGLNIAVILALVYILLLIIAVGYAFIAHGAKQLAAAGPPPAGTE
jgi:hypothetical protein